MSSEDEFETKLIKHLTDSHGNVQRFYGHIAGGTNVGMAFVASLSRPDTYMLRKAGKWQSLNHEDEFGSPKILETIEWLEEEAKKYDEDSSIWNLR